MPPVVRSFPPIATPRARVLILGSMPGLKSLQAGQYYAHPQNRFWPFMGALVGAAPALPYTERCARLQAAGIALWDVLASCERDGSLDTAIRDHGAEANPLAGFLDRHPGIGHLLFNGAKAEAVFQRVIAPGIGAGRVQTRRLPSTSPANASQPVAAKLAAWRDALAWAGVTVAG